MAQTLRRPIEQIDQSEVAAPGWYRERRVGAMLAVEERASAAERLDTIGLLWPHAG